MEWLWAAQVTVNFLFLVGMIFWWAERRNQRAMEMQLRLLKSNLEQRAMDMQVLADEARLQMDEKFAVLSTVGEQARILLQRGKEELGKRIPTLEEQELRGMLPNPAPTSANYSSQTARSAKSADAATPSSDMPLGLKAVLREQLL